MGALADWSMISYACSMNPNPDCAPGSPLNFSTQIVSFLRQASEYIPPSLLSVWALLSMASQNVFGDYSVPGGNLFDLG